MVKANKLIMLITMASGHEILVGLRLAFGQDASHLARPGTERMVSRLL